MSAILGTSLEVFPLCLGGNVFGWTADERESHAVLDAYIAAGGNFIDTADTYSLWAEGNGGGESETIIGRWLTKRHNRAEVIIATKVGGTGGGGLSARNIRERAEASLRRLRTDYVDLYYAHRDDRIVPLEESLGAFHELVHEGKVRYIAASNFGPDRLTEALTLSEREGLARFVALQTHYNLVVRDEYEGELETVCRRHHMSCLPYFALAKGFLTGKYRSGDAQVRSARASETREYGDERGRAILVALDEISVARETTMAAVALAWLLAQPTIPAAIASARTVDQLRDLIDVAKLRLTQQEVARLTMVSNSYITDDEGTARV
jgi:aryl-alcohol dehydrogenase-like predicted oxidoreductase